MNKWLKIILSLLLIVTFLPTTGVIAKITKDPKSTLKGLSRSVCSVIRTVKSGGSIKKISVKGVSAAFSKISGTVVLVARKLSALSSIDKSIFKGNSKSATKRKVIRVTGRNDSGTVELKGVGKSSNGYVFTLSSPGSTFCIDPKKKTLRLPLPSSVFQISFHNSSIEATGFGSDPVINVGKNGGIIKGKFKLGEGIGEGRFRLRLSR